MAADQPGPSSCCPTSRSAILLLTGGSGAGKTRAGAQGLAEIILSDTEPDGQFGVIGADVPGRVDRACRG